MVVWEYRKLLSSQDFTHSLRKHGDPGRYRHTSDRKPEAIPFSGDTSSHEDTSQCTATSTFRAQEPQHWLNNTTRKTQAPRVCPSSQKKGRSRSIRVYVFTIIPSECELRTYANRITLDSSKVVPDYPLDGGDSDSETGNAIRIPCNPTFDIPQPPMIPPTDLDRCDDIF